MWVRWFVLGLWVVSAAAAVGCVDEEPSACALNSDCAAPARCVEGACRLDCAEDRDCAEGLRCDEGQCVEAVVICRADADCAFAHACLQGTCERIDGFCQQNADCPSGQACARETNRCVVDDGGRPCQSVGDCFADELCQGGQCVERPEDSCALSSDCGVGQLCQGGRCVEGCRGDGDCLEGQICEAGQCAEGCALDSACPGGQRCLEGRCAAECALASDCGDGELCREGRCAPECVEDRDCASGQQCRAGRCAAECLVSSDCAGGQACRDGRCGPECVLDGDCPGGQRCEGGQCSAVVADYSGNFLISSTSPIQRCNTITSINFDPRVATAAQDGRAFSLTFNSPLTVYAGQIDGDSFAVSWSGPNGFTQNCGELNTSNTYTASFSGPDFFQGSLTVDFFFQLGECNCRIIWPIVGTRQ